MPDGEARVTIGSPELPEFLRSQYANVVNVNFTPWDFRFVFAHLTSPLQAPDPGAAELELHPAAVADVVIPASVMHGFITLLQEQFNRYLNQFGAPGLSPEGPGAT